MKEVVKPVSKKIIFDFPSAMLILAENVERKLRYLADKYAHEIGGFGLLDKDNPTRVIDFIVPKQEVSACSIVLGDLGNLLEEYVEREYEPWQVLRCWIHTHPKGIREPSQTDEDTFTTVMGKQNWAIMVIVPKEGQIYARLRYNTEPKIESVIPVVVERKKDDKVKEWDEEIIKKVAMKQYQYSGGIDNNFPYGALGVQGYQAYPILYDENIVDTGFAYLQDDPNIDPDADFTFEGKQKERSDAVKELLTKIDEILSQEVDLEARYYQIKQIDDWVDDIWQKHGMEGD